MQGYARSSIGEIEVVIAYLLHLLLRRNVNERKLPSLGHRFTINHGILEFGYSWWDGTDLVEHESGKRDADP